MSSSNGLKPANSFCGIVKMTACQQADKTQLLLNVFPAPSVGAAVEYSVYVDLHPVHV